MECDIEAIKKAIGHVSEDIDIEDDEELMAEFLALKDDNLQNSELVNIEQPKVLPKPKQLKQNFIVNELNFDNDIDVEISETDMHDNDLLSELDEIVGCGSNQKINVETCAQSSHNVASSEEVPSDPTSSESTNFSKNNTFKGDLVNFNQESKGQENFSQNTNLPPTSSSLGSIAHNLLIRRRKLYLERAKAAKEADDKTIAVEALQTEGVELSEDDIQQIPPSPPPYNLNKSKLDAKTDIKNSSVSQTVGHVKPDIEANKPYMSDELKLVLTRQLQLKEAALNAKKRGDMTNSKDLMTLALRMNQMVEAAKCGLPIDVQQIPSLPSTSTALSSKISKKSSVDPETLKKCQLLERELLKQITLCNEKSSQFQSIGDSKNTLFYESLLQNCKKNLQNVQMVMLGNSEFPGFKIIELTLPNIEINTSISDEHLQLKIEKITNLQLQKGWSASDLYLFVAYKFPFSNDPQCQQTGKTSVVKGTTSPEFTEVFHLNINRKNKFLRICKRSSLKLEIFQKGGFFRSDKLFGHADIPLHELEQNIFIRGQYNILEGRKRTNGVIHVDIRISKPIGVNNSGGAFKRKWVQLND